MKRITISSSAIIIVILLYAFLLTACSSVPAEPTVEPTPTINPTQTVPAPDETEEAASGIESTGALGQSVLEIATAVAQRTPLPTPTPGPIDRLAERAAQRVGGNERTFLGLTAEDWINLGISALYVIIAYYLAFWLLFGLARWVTRLTKTNLDDVLLDGTERELKWLVMITVIREAILRLVVLSDRLRSIFDDIFFVLILGVLYIISLRLVALTTKWYRQYRIPEGNRKQYASILETVARLGYLFVSTIVLSIVLSHFGIEVTLLSVVALTIIVIAALGARAAVEDAVSGFIILVDQPFRVDDVIFLKELDARGTVAKIGVRTTRLITGDGREVLVPNHLISTSQVVNFSHPDPSFRVQIDFLTAGASIEQVQQLTEETIRGVDGVLLDRPIDVFYLDFGGSAKGVRVRWWIGDVNDQNRVLNRVSVALDRALEEAGIDTPDPAYELNLKGKGQTTGAASQILSSDDTDESSLTD